MMQQKKLPIYSQNKLSHSQSFWFFGIYFVVSLQNTTKFLICTKIPCREESQSNDTLPVLSKAKKLITYSLRTDDEEQTADVNSLSRWKHTKPCNNVALVILQ